MKRFALVILFIFSSILSTFSNEGEILTLSGKFISKKGHAMAKKYGTDYFFQIKDEKGKTYAYPIMIKDKKLASMVRKNHKKVFTVVAIPTEKKMRVGEVSKYVHVLDIKEATLFTMKSLGVQEGRVQDQGSSHPYYDRTKEGQASPTFNISDTAANSIIFAAGAALLGSMLIP